ncbi:MAG: hypothetical protein WC891_05165 [Actinomycetota bacterium]
MKKTLLIGISALVLGAGLISPVAAAAYQGDPAVKGPNYTAERHEAMEKAFDAKDFDAWKNLMNGRGRVSQVVNKDNFAKFAEAHELAEQGKTAEAAKIRQELGLGTCDGSGAGNGTGGSGTCGQDGAGSRWNR